MRRARPANHELQRPGVPGYARMKRKTRKKDEKKTGGQRQRGAGAEALPSLILQRDRSRATASARRRESVCQSRAAKGVIMSRPRRAKATWLAFCWWMRLAEAMLISQIRQGTSALTPKPSAKPDVNPGRTSADIEAGTRCLRRGAAEKEWKTLRNLLQ